MHQKAAHAPKGAHLSPTAIAEPLAADWNQLAAAIEGRYHDLLAVWRAEVAEWLADAILFGTPYTAVFSERGARWGYADELHAHDGPFDPAAYPTLQAFLHEHTGARDDWGTSYATYADELREIAEEVVRLHVGAFVTGDFASAHPEVAASLLAWVREYPAVGRPTPDAHDAAAGRAAAPTRVPRRPELAGVGLGAGLGPGCVSAGALRWRVGVWGPAGCAVRAVRRGRA